ncbi:uncharacterized protein A1O9_12100 [Exophiala aquamarina CBS 119918]|uniref:Uncharacterized protein n=1 Tax=Exophiala aquamarina CBS 119918 TaxID=1182545 RepID=A0A072NXP4_9EURO|nr:uncharacterized protein A1O9_12100 [Exophiala aquamarina CBS 119918]KEF51763.1 hypothetical protein A1O9_12100 [Exophiala aquamarina CBS 119918]
MAGKTWITLVVTAPPGAATPPHTHNNAAVIATMIKGHMLNQMVHPELSSGTADTKDGCATVKGKPQPGPKVYGPGESWYEMPGCHHVRSENVGEEEAQFVANLVIDSSRLEAAENPVAGIFIIDAEEEEKLKLKNNTA